MRSHLVWKIKKKKKGVIIIIIVITTVLSSKDVRAEKIDTHVAWENRRKSRQKPNRSSPVAVEGSPAERNPRLPQMTACDLTCDFAFEWQR